MKPPWDSKYIKISFHVVVTILAVYLLYLGVNVIGYAVVNFAEVKAYVGSGIARVFSILSVVIIAFVIAYLIDPLVTFYQNEIDRINKSKSTSRAMGTSLAYLTLVLILSAAIIIIIIKTSYGKSDSGFIETLVESISRMRNDLSEFYAEMVVKFNKWGIAEFFADIAENIVDKLLGFIIDVPRDIAGILTSAGSGIANFMLALVIAFYFQKDKIKIKSSIEKTFKTFVPGKIAVKILNFLTEVNEIFEGYIRGQLTDAVIMGALFSVALSIIGVKFGVIIGIFSGFTNIVPYFGAFFAFILSVGVAFLSGSPMKALYTAIAMLVLQQIDATFIVPRVVGQKVKLSPVLVLISITIGGRLFGILGLIFAVPVCAIIKISLGRYMDKKTAKKIAADVE